MWITEALAYGPGNYHGVSGGGMALLLLLLIGATFLLLRFMKNRFLKRKLLDKGVSDSEDST